MNARERLLKVFNGETVDRVPVTLFILDQGEFINQLFPEVDPWDCEANQRKIIEFSKQMGVDVFLRVLFAVDDPEFVGLGVLGGLNVAEETEDWEVHQERFRKGDTETVRSTVRTPLGRLSQDFSITHPRPGTMLYACTKKPIESPSDLEIAARFEPGVPEAWRAKIREKARNLKEALGDSGVLGVWVPWGPFNNASYITNHDELYSLFLTEPEYYRKLMVFCLRRAQDYVSLWDSAGVDVICMGGNVPGGFIGRSNYERYVLPYEKESIAFTQRNGTPAIYHNCGEVMSLVESYKQLDVRIVEPFSPAPLGDADLARARELVNGDYVMLSGLDQVNVLRKGTVDQVKKATRVAMKTGKPGGKFILQNVDYLDYGTPLENLEAYVETALELADY
ncbi:MAG: uroporphyrinogen decarboxylase family protein [Rhodothermia bacterium]